MNLHIIWLWWLFFSVFIRYYFIFYYSTSTVLETWTYWDSWFIIDYWLNLTDLTILAYLLSSKYNWVILVCPLTINIILDQKYNLRNYYVQFFYHLFFQSLFLYNQNLQSNLFIYQHNPFTHPIYIMMEWIILSSPNSRYTVKFTQCLKSDYQTAS